jgi:hypothetical protein
MDVRRTHESQDRSCAPDSPYCHTRASRCHRNYGVESARPGCRLPQMRAIAQPGFFRACCHSGTITMKLEQAARSVVDCTDHANGIGKTPPCFSVPSCRVQEWIAATHELVLEQMQNDARREL